MPARGDLMFIKKLLELNEGGVVLSKVTLIRFVQPEKA